MTPRLKKLERKRILLKAMGENSVFKKPRTSLHSVGTKSKVTSAPSTTLLRDMAANLASAKRKTRWQWATMTNPTKSAPRTMDSKVTAGSLESMGLKISRLWAGMTSRKRLERRTTRHRSLVGRLVGSRIGLSPWQQTRKPKPNGPRKKPRPSERRLMHSGQQRRRHASRLLVQPRRKQNQSQNQNQKPNKNNMCRKLWRNQRLWMRHLAKVQGCVPRRCTIIKQRGMTKSRSIRTRSSKTLIRWTRAGGWAPCAGSAGCFPPTTWSCSTEQTRHRCTIETRALTVRQQLELCVIDDDTVVITTLDDDTVDIAISPVRLSLHQLKRREVCGVVNDPTEK
eukprot:m.128053 g.128053  ORF g.128053 m.128053 type:complete len:339 (-) comp17415_c0_seq2:267-1283(-)